MSFTNELQVLCATFGCSVLLEEPLAAHTSFKVGGAADAIVSVNCIASLQALLSFLHGKQVPYTILGRGSNVIASDTGYRGVVLLFGADFSDIRQDGTSLLCDAGASLKSVCRAAQRAGLTGLEFAYGIPGTIGGALYMNAGAYGGEMADVVQSAEYVDPEGMCSYVLRDEMQLFYRHSNFMGTRNIIVRVRLNLKPDDPAAIQQRMDETLAKRIAKQPLEYPSAGSTFKRPQGDYASRLVEICGLKGMSVGGAQVSKKHSGFVINTGGATCADILGLCAKVQEIVKEKTGFQLELEPVLLGDCGQTK